MPLPHALLRPPRRRRWPGRTARLRFAAVYGALFLISGAVLVATTYVLFERATEYHQPQLPQIPRTPTIKAIEQQPGPHAAGLALALPALAHDQLKLAQAQYQLSQTLKGPGKPVKYLPPLGGSVNTLAADRRQLSRDQRQLTKDQHQLAKVQRQLVVDVEQVARAGSVEAAQRAADSHQLLVDSAIALAIVAVLALAAGWIVAGRMLRPIRLITRTARRISSASLHERLALDGPEDELKELGDTLDDLFDRLEASFEAQRQFAANASHELRTPLARQRALIQVALADPNASFSSLRAAHERVLASERQLEQMIEALLTLARGQAGLERSEPVDLELIASHALLARESELAARELDVSATLDAAPALGDPRLLERLVANLLDNAIRHNVARGAVEIATGTREHDTYVSVTNSGPAVPPDEIQRLFEPFQRLGAGRTRHNSGHGLGLSIVHAIADAHGATLSVHARAQGGLTIEVSLPPAGADPASRAALAAGATA